ncbi:MAG: hypothetical protein ABIE55_04320 [Candidatus Aenigmatarchaeota archaeon]
MKGKQLRNKILEVVEKEWPVSITEIARHLGLYKKSMDERKRKTAVAKVVYHVRKLEKEEKVRTKKIGQTIIIWPLEIEKLRLIHEMIR